MKCHSLLNVSSIVNEPYFVHQHISIMLKAFRWFFKGLYSSSFERFNIFPPLYLQIRCFIPSKIILKYEIILRREKSIISNLNLCLFTSFTFAHVKQSSQLSNHTKWYGLSNGLSFVHIGTDKAMNCAFSENAENTKIKSNQQMKKYVA